MIWAIVVGIGVIVALIGGIIDIHDRFFNKPNVDYSDSGISGIRVELKEYIFGNQYFYLQAIADKSGRVIGYGITSRSENFKPSVTILGSAFSNDIPLEYTVVLGETRFVDFPHIPERIYSSLGVRRFNYYEKYYFGNPGHYQSYIFAFNDSGVGTVIGDDDLGFPNGYELSMDDVVVKKFRERSRINTLFITAPFEDFSDSDMERYLIGPDYDQVRVIPDAAIRTVEPASVWIAKLKSLATEVNIQFYIDRFGQPLIVNDRSYLEAKEPIR